MRDVFQVTLLLRPSVPSQRGGARAPPLFLPNSSGDTESGYEDRH